MVEVHWEERIAILTMKSESAFNILDMETLDGLITSLNDVVHVQGATAVVLTGAGRAFSGGGDIKWFEARLREGLPVLQKEVLAMMDDYGNPITRFIAECPVPVVSAINGPCIGGAFGFALAADIAVCARSAYFLVPQASMLGLVPDCGISWLAPRLAGRSRALGMTLLGERISGEKAEQWGMVWECVDDANVLSQALTYARRLGRLPAGAVIGTRRLIDQACRNELAATLADERAEQRELLGSDYFRQACTNFSAQKSGK